MRSHPSSWADPVCFGTFPDQLRAAAGRPFAREHALIYAPAVRSTPAGCFFAGVELDAALTVTHAQKGRAKSESSR